MRKRQFEVSGIDDLGDVHNFSSDDRARAEEMVELMSEYLEDVQLVDRD